MNESNPLTKQVKQYFSARATLVGLGLKVSQMKLFEPITQKVKIAQKKVKFSPTEKLLDGFISILAGAHGLVEINKRVGRVWRDCGQIKQGIRRRKGPLLSKKLAYRGRI